MSSEIKMHNSVHLLLRNLLVVCIIENYPPLLSKEYATLK